MQQIHESFKILALSSLAKVFADEYPPYREIRKISALKNETVSFQAAYYCDRAEDVSVSVVSDFGENARLYTVGLIPAEMLAYPGHDADVLRTMPGLFPDLLTPMEEHVRTFPGQWRSTWVEIRADEHFPSGTHPVAVQLKNGQGEVLGSVEVDVEILDAVLPEQTLCCTNWFHTDCLSTWYRTPVFSDAYWKIVENYMKAAAAHGINMILTPLFTPPLDTAVGSERPTVQLVDVRKENGGYRFGFGKLERWIKLAARCGIKHFEMSHLFTQWGAEHAPKIMAETETGARRIFGWETDALGEEYTDFLRQFAAALVPFLEKAGVAGQCLFHVSDEPSMEVFDRYSRASALIRELFRGFRIIDALSDFGFYEKGAVRTPIPATDQIGPFIGKVPELWAYYCCGQYRKVSNRFFCMPSARNRILGMQLYKFDVKGFLQWGFNFWYSCQSVRPINPFVTTDGGNAWPSGDPFVVYPGENGTPLASLRLKVFREGLQDMRALQLLESLAGREKTMALLEDGLDEPIDFDCYPKSDEWLLFKREQINRSIAQRIKK